VRWVRSQAAEVEGLYASPIPVAAADHVVAVVNDLVTRYGIDGLHLDYLRYPNESFDYSHEALALFRAEVSRDLPPAERLRYDAQAAEEPLVYTTAFPKRWRDFRRARLASLLMRLRTTLKAAKPDAWLSAAVIPEPGDAAAHRLQDWRTWLDTGLLDVVCPMAYTADPAVFSAQIAMVRQVAGVRPVWAGIGAYRLTAAQTVDNILTARRLGATGVILFSYDSLSSPHHGADYLAQIGRGAFDQ
jgi:uncharacterized lipoprotein YddW (UPF0748 family)